MTIDELISDKTIKPKEKTDTISKWILDQSLPVDELIRFAEKQKDAIKATCVEAMEYATKVSPGIAGYEMLVFASQNLAEKSPRIKWESARVIGNIAHLFPDNLAPAVIHLLENTKHEGTVVRWSAALALGEILKLKTKNHADLVKAIETAHEKEVKNSIKKIYSEAVKKYKKSLT